ncbi:hypothetical protein [Streptomyces sp. KR80]|uniref:hypothetical protein n=1 Tax=Streptomyces sp. KR80 TaxID=3457426 RepID=UPI003FD15881
MIPLRPLSLGDLLNGAFSVLGRYWAPVFGFTAAILGLLALVVAAVGAAAYASVADTLSVVLDPLTPSADPVEPSRSQLIAVLTAFGVVLPVWALAGLLAMSALQAAYPAIVSQAVLGRPITIGETWRQARPRLLSVLGAQLLTGLFLAPVMLLMVLPVMLMPVVAEPLIAMVTIMAIFFLTVPLGMFVYIRLSLAPTAAALEKQSPVAALRRSWGLVAGSWWRVFGITVLASLIASAVSQFVQMPFAMAGMFSVPLADVGPEGPSFAVLGGVMGLALLGALLGTALTIPFGHIVTALLYVDLRIRRESLDLSLAAAAGLPPHRPAP